MINISVLKVKHLQYEDQPAIRTLSAGVRPRRGQVNEGIYPRQLRVPGLVELQRAHQRIL